MRNFLKSKLFYQLLLLSIIVRNSTTSTTTSATTSTTTSPTTSTSATPAISLQNEWPDIMPYALPHEVNKTKAMAWKACKIANAAAAHINFIYACDLCQQNASMARLQNELYKCFSELQLPLRLQRIQRIRQMRLRMSSLSIFLIPDITWHAAVTYALNLTSHLNARQTQKHFHKFIFIWRGALPTQLRELFYALWEQRILQAIALTDQQRVYTFEPFSAAGFQVRLVDWRGGGFGSGYFYDKLKNLHHHELRISMFADFLRAKPLPNSTYAGYEAVDGCVAREIGKRLNATLRYIVPRDQQKYGSCKMGGNFTGAVGDVIAGRTQIGFNTRFVMTCMQAHVEQLYPFYRRVLFLVVPAAKMRPVYRIFFDAFDQWLWLALLLNFVLVFTLFYTLQLLVQRFIETKTPQSSSSTTSSSSSAIIHWYDVFELILKTQFGEPVSGFARISSLRQFLIAWILCGYIFSSVYFAKLESSFVHPAYEPNMNKLSELPQLKVPIYGVSNLVDAVRFALDKKYWRAMHVVRLPLNYSGDETAMRDLAFKQNKRIAFILRGETARDFIRQTYDTQANRPTFHIVNEYLRSLPRSYIMTKGSPYLYKFQFYFTCLQESGILDFLLNRDLRRRGNYTSAQLSSRGRETAKDFANNLQNYMADNARTHVVLNLEILQGAFYLYALGIFCSFLGFILEIIWWFWRESRKRTFFKQKLGCVVVKWSMVKMKGEVKIKANLGRA